MPSGERHPGHGLHQSSLQGLDRHLEFLPPVWFQARLRQHQAPRGRFPEERGSYRLMAMRGKTAKNRRRKDRVAQVRGTLGMHPEVSGWESTSQWGLGECPHRAG